MPRTMRSDSEAEEEEVPEEDEGKAEESQMNRLMRVHRNLGHPYAQTEWQRKGRQFQE